MTKRPPILPLLASALRLRCPNCHRGRVFQRFPNKVFPRCEVCGLSFIRESGYYLGGMILTYVLTAFVLLGVFLLSLAVPLLGNMRENVQHVFWIALAIVLTLLLVRPAYSLWLSGDFWVEPWTPEESPAKR